MSYFNTEIKESGFVCHYCRVRTNVYNVRNTRDGKIRRYRECPECGMRFTTIEEVSDIYNEDSNKQCI